jgi:hypothetical protein
VNWTRRERSDPPSPKATPCQTCPFRVANFGRTPGGRADTFYTPEKREQIWNGPFWEGEDTGLRHGDVLCCHQSGPPLVGGTNAKATEPRACAAAVVLQQRELLRLREDDYEGAREDGSSLSARGL